MSLILKSWVVHVKDFYLENQRLRNSEVVHFSLAQVEFSFPNG